MDEDHLTIWCGNLSESVTEEILYELFLQGGPIHRVSIPKNRNGKQRRYAFVTYKHPSSVSYALRLFNGTKLFNRCLSMRRRNNMDSSQAEPSPDNSLNFDQLLLSGQQLLFTDNGFNSVFQPHDVWVEHRVPKPTAMIHNNADARYSEDRNSRRIHPDIKQHSRSRHDNDSRNDTRSKINRSRNTHPYRDRHSRYPNYNSSRFGYR